jgi:hypothetical protein
VYCSSQRIYVLLTGRFLEVVAREDLVHVSTEARVGHEVQGGAVGRHVGAALH